MNRLSLSAPFEGLLYWVALLTFIALLIVPQAIRIMSANGQKTEKLRLIEQHHQELARPAPADDSLAYKSFVYDASSDDPSTLRSSDIQSLLSEQARLRQARLLNLRELPAPSPIGELTGARFALEIEGDLTAMLETIESIGQLGVPILIDQLELKPVGQTERPDQAMQLQLNLTVWMGNPN